MAKCDERDLGNHHKQTVGADLCKRSVPVLHKAAVRSVTKALQSVSAIGDSNTRNVRINAYFDYVLRRLHAMAIQESNDGLGGNT